MKKALLLFCYCCLALSLYGQASGGQIHRKVATKEDSKKEVAASHKRSPQIKLASNGDLQPFNVAIAAVSSKDEAVKYYNKLKEDGYSAYIYLDSYKLYRVAVQGFYLMDKAALFRDNLRRRNTLYSNAYVFSVNNNEAFEVYDIKNGVIETDTHKWELLAIQCSRNKTILMKRVTPKIDNSWFNIARGEFIEDVESGKKFYIQKSYLGFLRVDLVGKQPKYFNEEYPPLPSELRRVNVTFGYNSLRNIYFR